MSVWFCLNRSIQIAILIVPDICQVVVIASNETKKRSIVYVSKGRIELLRPL